MEAGAGKGFHVAPQHALFPFCRWKSKFPPSPYPRVKPQCPGRLQAGWARAARGCPPRHPAGPRPALPRDVLLQDFPAPSTQPVGSKRLPRVPLSQCSGGLCSPWALRSLHMSSNPHAPCPQRRDAGPLGAALGPEVAPGRSCTTALMSCRTAVTAAGGTHSVSPALPGSSRTAGATTAARPASPAPSSTASRSPTAQRRPTLSAGSVCRGERGRSCAGDTGGCGDTEGFI